MKKDSAYLLTIFTLLILVIGGSQLLRKSHQKELLLESVIAEKQDSIRYRTNENGKILAEKRAAEIHTKDLEKMYPEVAAELERSFDIKIKNLKAYIKNEFSAQGAGTGIVTNNHYYDSANSRTIRFRDFNMHDGYLTFNTRLYDSLSSSLYKYTYSDTAQTVISSKRKWLFGKEQLYSTTMFSNPNSKITGTTNILIKNHRDKRFAVMIGAGYDPFQRKPTAMVGLGWTLIKF